MGSTRSSARSPASPSLKTALVVSLAALMAACGTTGGPSPVGPTPPPTQPEGTQVTTRDGLTPPFMANQRIVRVGLLLPFSQLPQEGNALFSAAELALFTVNDPNVLLIPRDAGATEAETAAVARALVENDGADIIIGPVLRDGVAGAAQAARTRNVPVIGFSSDRTVAGNGVYLLSFQLEDEVARIIDYAASRGIRSIALIAPSTEYGRRVEQAFRAEAQARGVAVPAVESYARNESAAAATRLATTLRASPAQAILIADSGTALRNIGPTLVQNGIDPRQVRFLGTSVWAGDAQREPTLNGGWYVTTDPTARENFEQRFQSTFNRAPTRLSSLAYDAVTLASALSRQDGARGFTPRNIENNEGYMGADGLFRFRSNGAIERGLAVMEVRGNTVAPLDAAPRAFPGPTG